MVGRKKDLLIIGGENIYPQDIEEIVATHPAVHDGRAIASGLYNPDLGTEEIVVIAKTRKANPKIVLQRSSRKFATGGGRGSASQCRQFS